VTNHSNFPGGTSPQPDDADTFDLAEDPVAPPPPPPAARKPAPAITGDDALDLAPPVMESVKSATAVEEPKLVDPGTAMRRRDDARKKWAEEQERIAAAKRKRLGIILVVVGIIGFLAYYYIQRAMKG
jgi:hypothetical protein